VARNGRFSAPEFPNMPLGRCRLAAKHWLSERRSFRVLRKSTLICRLRPRKFLRQTIVSPEHWTAPGGSLHPPLLFHPLSPHAETDTMESRMHERTMFNAWKLA
jgi:hypothetical protein